MHYNLGTRVEVDYSVMWEFPDEILNKPGIIVDSFYDSIMTDELDEDGWNKEEQVEMYCVAWPGTGFDYEFIEWDICKAKNPQATNKEVASLLLTPEY